MLNLIIGITARIFSNSYLNVFQKILTGKGESNSVINFYTYLGLSLLCLFLFPQIIISQEIILNFLMIGLLGALGNYFIIKALACGELSSVAPINSYKPIVALIIGIYLLKEYPNIYDIIGIILIVMGTFFLSKSNTFFSKACGYRFLALLFSASEAIFIKKIILLTNVTTSFFYWSLSGLIFSLLFVLISKHKIKIKKESLAIQIYLVIMVALMQYSTNFVFSKMNVAPTLALFQLSTILSVFLGTNIFKEKDILKKLSSAVIMCVGAIIIILL